MNGMFNKRRAFTLIELLVVIAILAILAVVVVLVLNPAELLAQSRDTTRLSDMTTLTSAVNLYNTDQSGASSFSLGSSSVLYVSVPDPMATTTAGDQCEGLGLPAIPTGWTYHCAASSTYHDINGTGWLPVDLKNISSGSPLGSLPVDPVNQTSTGYYYTYATNGAQFELTSLMESQKYNLGGSDDKVSTDGGILPDTYEAGTIKNLLIADRGREVAGEWLLDEGTGTVAYDSSIYGNNGIVYNSPTWTTGAIVLNGTNQYIEASNALTNISAFTLSFWMNTTVWSSEIPLSIGWYIKCYGGMSANNLDCMDAGGGVIETTNLDDGNWHQVDYTVNGMNESIYVDGVLEATSTESPAGDGANIDIGAIQGTSNFYAGTIDDVRIYDQALSAAAVASLYDAGHQ